MKIVINYFNFNFYIESNYKKYAHKILNFILQFIKNMKWHFGFTDSICHPDLTFNVYLYLMVCVGSSTFKQIWYFFSVLKLI